MTTEEPKFCRDGATSQSSDFYRGDLLLRISDWGIHLRKKSMIMWGKKLPLYFFLIFCYAQSKLIVNQLGPHGMFDSREGVNEED